MAHVGPFTAALADRLQRRWCDLEDWIFERRLGIDVGGVVEASQLGFANPSRAADANAYQAVWTRNIRKLLATSAQTTAVPLRNFVDIGSGKGKACFYAAKKGRFEQVIGVEYSESLMAAALANLRKLPLNNITFIHSDATLFDLPAGPSLVFLFNSFGDAMMTAFLERNIKHFAKYQSQIAYANDKQRAVLRHCGFETLFRDPVRQISLHRLPSQ